MIWDLKRNTPSLAGKCFENCVIAVLALNLKPELHYVLGFVTPPGYGSYAHAWLQQESENGPVYFDPTLEDSSPLWGQRNRDFVYDKRFIFTRTELLEWFKERYPDRQFSDRGVPDGMIRGTIITPEGRLE